LKALITYLTYSGNTEEVAEIIEMYLKKEGFEVITQEIGRGIPVNPSSVDFVFLGTFTWVNGSVPDEIKDYILEIGYKPENIAIFGTGDTQFGGEEWFCRAVDKLVKFYKSKWKGLKIEQSPRGYQEEEIFSWIEGVLEDVKVTH